MGCRMHDFTTVEMVDGNDERLWSVVVCIRRSMSGVRLVVE